MCGKFCLNRRRIYHLVLLLTGMSWNLLFGRPHPRLAFDGILAAGRGHKRPAFERRGFGESNFRHFRRFAAKREILPQRKIRIAFPHQNPAQIGMAAKPDAHHVVDFALVPIRRAPHADDGRQFGFFLADAGFEPQFATVREAAQMINIRPARVFAIVVNAA